MNVRASWAKPPVGIQTVRRRYEPLALISAFDGKHRRETLGHERGRRATRGSSIAVVQGDVALNGLCGMSQGDSADNPNTSGSAVSASGSTANSPSGLSQATEATQGCGGRSLETARSRDPSVDRSEVSVFEHRSSLDDPGKQLPSVQRNRSVSADGIGIKDEAILLLKVTGFAGF